MYSLQYILGIPLEIIRTDLYGQAEVGLRLSLLPLLRDAHGQVVGGVRHVSLLLVIGFFGLKTGAFGPRNPPSRPVPGINLHLEGYRCHSMSSYRAL